MAAVRLFEDLDICKLSGLSIRNVRKIANKTALRKDGQLYGQTDGSSSSIVAVIAKDFEPSVTRRYRQFLSISKAMWNETRVQPYRVFDRNNITMDNFIKLKKRVLVISTLINGYITPIKK